MSQKYDHIEAFTSKKTTSTPTLRPAQRSRQITEAERRRYRDAFSEVISEWQDIRSNHQRIATMDFSVAFENRISNGRQCAAVIRPTGSDFGVEVENAARNALRGSQRLHFKTFYLGDEHLYVPDHLQALDREVREVLGEYFLRAGIASVAEYMKPIDTRVGPRPPVTRTNPTAGKVHPRLATQLARPAIRDEDAEDIAARHLVERSDAQDHSAFEAWESRWLPGRREA